MEGGESQTQARAAEGLKPRRGHGAEERVIRVISGVLILAALILGGCHGVTKEQQALKETGIALLDAGDYLGALNNFEQITAKAKRVTDFELDVLKYRAEAEFGLEDYDAALYTYGMLKELDRERPEYLYLEAVCFARKRETAEAEERLAAAIEADQREVSGDAAAARPHSPGYAEAMTALGDAYRDAGNAGEAQKIYGQLMDAGLAGASLYNQMGLACMKTEDYEQAFLYLTQGLALPDGEGKKELMFNRAVCLEYLGRYEEALTAFREYTGAYGSSGEAEHEIAFLETR